MVIVRLCRIFGWTWDYAEGEVTYDQLIAINKSVEIFPADYEMVAFMANAWGYQKAKREAEAAVASKKSEGAHSGGALVMLFPDGKVSLDGLAKVGTGR